MEGGGRGALVPLRGGLGGGRKGSWIATPEWSRTCDSNDSDLASLIWPVVGFVLPPRPACPPPTPTFLFPSPQLLLPPLNFSHLPSQRRGRHASPSRAKGGEAARFAQGRSKDRCVAQAEPCRGSRGPPAGPRLAQAVPTVPAPRPRVAALAQGSGRSASDLSASIWQCRRSAAGPPPCHFGPEDGAHPACPPQ